MIKGSYSTYAIFPLIVEVPEVWIVSPKRAWSSVVLPEPIGPTTTNKPLLSNLMLIFSMTGLISIFS